MAKTLTDIDYVIYPSNLRMEYIQDITKDYKEYKKLEDGIKRIVDNIFRQAYIKEHSLEIAILAVYMTGLYHGDSLSRKIQ